LNEKVALVPEALPASQNDGDRFARVGAKSSSPVRREKEGAQVVDEIKKFGGDAAFFARTPPRCRVKAMVDFTSANTAGSTSRLTTPAVEWTGPLDQATEAEYRRVFDIITSGAS